MIQDLPSTSKDYSNPFKLSKIILKRKRKNSLSTLTDDVLVEIIQRLSNFKDVQKLKLINKKFNCLINNNFYRFSRPEIDGIIISINKQRIISSEIGKLRINENNDTFVEIILTKKDKKMPLVFKEKYSNEQQLINFLIKILKRYKIKETVSFNNVNVTNELISTLLKPFVMMNTVTCIKFISTTFSNNLNINLFNDLLLKLNVKKLNIEYCSNIEIYLTENFVINLKNLTEFVLLPLPNQQFLQLNDYLLNKYLKNIKYLILTNCQTSFTPLGIYQFIQNLNLNNKNHNMFNYDLGLIKSHPFDVEKFAKLNIFILNSKQQHQRQQKCSNVTVVDNEQHRNCLNTNNRDDISDDNDYIINFYYNSSNKISTFQQNNTTLKSNNNFIQKFYIDMKLTFNILPTINLSNITKQCINPFEFIANIANIRSAINKQVLLQPQSTF